MVSDTSSEDDPTSWRAIPAQCPVYSSDGVNVGRVREVLALDSGDIFHGILVDTAPPVHTVSIPASEVVNLTMSRVTVRMSSEEFRTLEAYDGPDSYHLGIADLPGGGPEWINEVSDGD